MKRIVTMLAILLGIVVSMDAQKYNTAIGVRKESSAWGVTLQQRFAKNSTMEAIFIPMKDKMSGTLLIERHHPILFRGLNYYLGAGGHLAQSGVNDELLYGIDGILGLELKTPLLPLTVSFDLKPTYHLNEIVLDETGATTDKFSMGGAFSLRYILFRDTYKRK